MKKAQITVILLTVLMVIIPWAGMNTEPKYTSAVDNRYLAEFPDFSNATIDKLPEYTQEIQNYIDDRVSLRTQTINLFHSFNRNFLHRVSQPGYIAGKDGHIFSSYTGFPINEEYNESFASFIKMTQEYVHSYGKEFIFVLSPAKIDVYGKYAPTSLMANDDVNRADLERRLETHKVDFVSLVYPLRNAADAGKQVYNREYDPNHWNDLGALVGVNTVLDALKQNGVGVSAISESSFEVTETLHTKLNYASNYPISDYILTLTPKLPGTILQDDGDIAEFDINPTEPTKSHSSNHNISKDITALAFQDSYFNGREKFFSQGFADYYAIHSYLNLFKLPYYMNLTDPNVVIVTGVPYSIQESFFPQAQLENVTFPEPLTAKQMENAVKQTNVISANIQQGDYLTRLCLALNTDATNAGDYFISNGKRTFTVTSMDPEAASSARSTDGNADSATTSCFGIHIPNSDFNNAATSEWTLYYRKSIDTVYQTGITMP